MREKLTVSTWFARATIRYIFAFRRDAICRGDLERTEGSRFLREGGSRTGQEASRCSLGRLRILFRRDGERFLRVDVLCYMERSNVYVRSSRNRRQKINPERHTVVCINIGKSMVTRDVGVPPQNRPIGSLSRPHLANLLHLPTRASACSFRSRLLHRPDARDRERCWKGSTPSYR